MQVQAAAISIAGNRFVVVVVDLGLVQSSGEADMALDRLSDGFGGVPVVLMGQRENGTPVYYGDPELVESLREVPLEQMPFKTYNVSG